MNVDRAFELAGRQRKATEIVVGHAHAAVNAMARGPVQDRAKVAIGEVREMCEAAAALTLEILPFTLEYYEGMPEAELRQWAADLVSTLRG